MKLQIVSLTFCLIAVPVYAAEEVYEQENIGFAESQNKACEEALLFAKKDALDSAGTIVRASIHNNQEVTGKQVNQTASVDIRQLSNGLIKVINKSTEVEKKNGGFSCHVKVKLSIDTASVLQHNKAYEGQVPEWAVSPPRILGKITSIDSGKTLDGAIAKALVKYVENSLNPGVKFKAIKSEAISPGGSVVVSEGNAMLQSCYTGEIGHTTCTEVFKGIFDAQISPNIILKWLVKKYAKARDDEIVESDEVIASRVTFKAGPNEREFGNHRKVEKVSSLEEPTVEDESTITKKSASTDMVIAELRNSGFIVEYELVESDAAKEWFVMLINKPNTLNFSTKLKLQ